MKKYFLILGRNEALSLAEAVSLLQGRLKKPNLLAYGSFLIFEADEPIDFWSEFGGAIKFGEIIGEIKEIAEIKADIFIPHLDKEKKNFFGISFYKESPTPPRPCVSRSLGSQAGRGGDGERSSPSTANAGQAGRGRNRPDVFKLGMTLKRQFEEKNVKIRLVTSKEETLSSVVVKTNKLLTRGLEAVILDAGDKLFIGKTLAVQEFADYEFRDYGRPGRDPLSGMIPPKLAKMMLNLSTANAGQAGTKKEDIILDPFCGSGTILTEAAILGYTNLIGADISEKAVDDSKKNMEWVKNNYRLQTTDYRLQQIDVREISKMVAPNSVDAIVTEPYLGPPLHGNERADTIKKITDELGNLYTDSFPALFVVAKKGAIMVMVVPLIKIGGKEYTIQFNSGGWQEEKIKIDGKEISPLIWSRPDQKVIREIRIYKKG